MELEGQRGLLALFWGREHPETDFVAKDKQDAPVFMLPCSHEASLTGKKYTASTRCILTAHYSNRESAAVRT